MEFDPSSWLEQQFFKFQVNRISKFVILPHHMGARWHIGKSSCPMCTSSCPVTVTMWISTILHSEHARTWTTRHQLMGHFVTHIRESTVATGIILFDIIFTTTGSFCARKFVTFRFTFRRFSCGSEFIFRFFSTVSFFSLPFWSTFIPVHGLLLAGLWKENPW